MQEKRHDRVVEMRLCFFSGKAGDYKMLFAAIRKCCSTIDNILETLNNMEVVNIEDMCFMSTYSSSQVCTALNAVFDLGLDKKYYQPKELNKKIKKISG